MFLSIILIVLSTAAITMMSNPIITNKKNNNKNIHIVYKDQLVCLVLFSEDTSETDSVDTQVHAINRWSCLLPVPNNLMNCLAYKTN